MKIALKLYQWIIISLIFQVILLIFINYIYLERKGEVKATSIDITEPHVVTNEELEIPLAAKNTLISYDASSVAYILEGDIHIMNIKTHTNSRIIKGYNNPVSYYRWLTDRNMIIYAKALNINDSTEVQLITADIGSGVEREYPKITGLPFNSEVKDIELSELTNIVYVKIQTSDTRMRVYKFNIMSNLSFVLTTNIDNPVLETNYKDNLLYQDDNRNKLLVLDGTTNDTRTIQLKDKMVLLGVDGEDRVYLGQLDQGNTISKIYYGKLEEEIETGWEKIQFPNSILTVNIKISRAGKVYIVEENEKKIVDIKAGNKISYQGKLIQLLDGGMVTFEGNQLKVKSLLEK